MNKPPSTIRECLLQLVICIEDTSCNYTQKQKGDLMDMIRVQHMGYLKLKEYLQKNQPQKE